MNGWFCTWSAHLGYPNSSTGVKVWVVHLCGVYMCVVYVCVGYTYVCALTHTEDVPMPGSVQRVCMPVSGTKVTTAQKAEQADSHPP